MHVKHEQLTAKVRNAVDLNPRLVPVLPVLNVMSRYASKYDWEITHRDGQAFQALGAWSKSSGINLTKTGQSYYEGDIGYM